MLDINGQKLLQGAAASLLCEIIEISEDSVRVRVMNSELEIEVEVKHDEVLGGLVADSELTAFHEARVEFQPPAQNYEPADVDGVRLCPME